MYESYERVSHFRGYKRIRVQAQPYRELDNPKQVLPQWQKDMAHWANRKQLYKTIDFKEFIPRKGFICSKYFRLKPETYTFSCQNCNWKKAEKGDFGEVKLKKERCIWRNIITS